MAALCTGISYGLSQSCLSNENKELIFVKLTDSAYRAIEEYQKNQNKLSSHATIQFLGHDGYLSFPSLSNSGGQKFSFTIAEADGLQGSFECIKQNQNQLEVLGSLPQKMRIHANEDVYEATRHRMAVAEENQKNKCTREIKPNQTDIGRKVKVKTPIHRLLPNIPNNNATLNKRDSISSSSSSSSSTFVDSSSNNTNSLNNTSNLNNLNNLHSNSNNNNSNTINNNLNSNNNTNDNHNSLTASPLKNNFNVHHHHQQQQNHSNNSNHNNHHQHLISNNSSSGSSNAARIVQANRSISNDNGKQHNSNANNNHNQPTSTTGGGMDYGTANTDEYGAELNKNTMRPSLKMSGCGAYKYSNMHHSGSTGNNNVVPNRAASGRNNSSSNSYGRTSDIMKRPIKERLIHMLALRPYKKPEIYLRISNEGVKEREKACIGTLLKSLSYMRDNTYHLHRHLWNDVHEDWPFYTEQDRQSLKRRKPENLTPPFSSDGGSSTSGQSPTSTHNGSPPPAVKRPPLNSDKYSSSADGPASKKQRISHYRKDIVNQETNSLTSRSKYNSNSYPLCSDDNLDMLNNYRRDLVHDTRVDSAINSRSRDLSMDDSSMRSSSYYGSSVTPNAQESEDSGLSLGYSSAEASKRMSSSSSSISEQDHDEKNPYDDDVKVLRQKGSSKNLLNSTGSGGYDFSQFTRITSIEQRRKYKTEFDNDYTEYMRLHAENERVSKRFAQLEESLRNQQNNDQKYKEIQRQILNEFKNTMRNQRHQEIKKRFDYLHHKLSHIKRLVNEFDSTITNGQKLDKNY